MGSLGRKVENDGRGNRDEGSLPCLFVCLLVYLSRILDRHTTSPSFHRSALTFIPYTQSLASSSRLHECTIPDLVFMARLPLL